MTSDRGSPVRRPTAVGAAGAALSVLALCAWWWFAAEPSPPFAASDPVGKSTHADVAPVQGDLVAPGAMERRSQGVVARPDPGPGAWELPLQVVDAHGRPVGAATVELAREPMQEPFERSRARGDGCWQGAVAGEVVWVRARHELVGTSVQVPCAAAMARERLVLPLLRPVLVQGVVIGADAAPVGGAQVIVRGELAVRRAEVGVVAPTRPLLADHDGRFRFEAAAGARLVLSASDGAFPLAAERDVIAVDGLEVLLAAHDAFQVHGVLLDPHGHPVVPEVARDRAPGFAGADGSSPFEEYMPHGLESPMVFVDARAGVTVGEGGAFRATASVGRLRVRAQYGDLMAPAVACELSLARPRAEVVLQLATNVATRGVVVDVAGAPVANARVVAVAADPSFQPVVRQVATDGAGAFVLPLPVGSSWQLAAGAGDRVAVVAGTQQVRLVLEGTAAAIGPPFYGLFGDPFVDPLVGGDQAPAEAITFEVVDAHGAPAVYPWFHWYHVHEGSVERAAAGVGLTIAQVLPAPWRLVAHEQGSMASVHHVFVPGAPWPRQLRLQLQAPSSLVVTVRRAGKPMRGLDLEVDPCGPVECTPGDAAGVFRIARVSHGPAVLRVLRGAEVLAAQSVELVSGQPFVGTIDLPP